MREMAKTMTIRWPNQPVDEVRERLLAELDRMAITRWGFLGFRRVKWEVRRHPETAELAKVLARQIRLDAQLGNPGFVLPEDAEVWEGWAEYEEMSRWTVVEEGADRWTS